MAGKVRNIKVYFSPIKLHYGLIMSTWHHAICHYTKYETIIFWSEEDNAYIAEVQQLPGCMAHGDTYESAWIEAAKEFGDSIPEPKGRRLMYAQCHSS